MSLKDNSFKLTIDNVQTELVHPILMGARLVASTEQVAAQYFNSTKRDSGILPPVVRYASADFQGFVIERPPTEVLIEFKPAPKGEDVDTQEYVLQIPWQVYGLRFGDPELNYIEFACLFARNTTVYSEDDELFRFPLPNVFADGNLCALDMMRVSLTKLPKKYTDTTTAINCCINAFWESGFNCDLVSNLTYSGPFQGLSADYATDGEHARAQMAFKIWSGMSMNEVLDLEYAPTRWEVTDDKGYTLTEHVHVRDLIQRVDGIKPGAQKQKATDQQPFLEYIRQLTLKAANK